MSHYTMLSIYGQCTRQLKIERASWFFFSRRIEWRPKKIVFIRRILENTISLGKKKPQEFVWKFIEKHMKIHETKIRRPATKEDKYVSSWSRSHSPIDSCSLFIRNKNINHKQLATNAGYAAIHYSNSGVGIRHDWATEGIVFLHCSYFCNCTKNPNSQ